MADPKSASDLALASMSQGARNYYQEHFLPRYKELQQHISETPLAVLIWGPGPGSDLYAQRLLICEQLRSEGVAALLSEEVNEDMAGTGMSVRENELVKAIVADFIILLVGSPASTAEVHDFAFLSRDFGSKLLVFVDQRATGGYSYSGALAEMKALYGNVYTFEYPRDIEEANLLKVVLERVRVLRFAKWRASLQP